jgi:hypothetical protein
VHSLRNTVGIATKPFFSFDFLPIDILYILTLWERNLT